MGKTYVVSYIVAALCVLNTNAANIIWKIGKADNSASELLLVLLVIRIFWQKILVMKIGTS